MRYVRFMIDDKPMACWDWELDRKNLEYIQGIDVEFYRYVANAYAEDLLGDNKQQAAMATRIAYYQGQETLFALLVSAVQAPACIVGWNLAYKTDELVSVVDKISRRDQLYTHARYGDVTWQTLADRVHDFLGWPEEKLQWIKAGFGRLWSGFASEFVDPKNRHEYNALKHGLRPRPGGFGLAIGPQTDPSTPCPAEKMISLGRSETGSSFFVLEKIGPTKTHFRPRSVAKNWSIENTVNGLHLLAMSIENVVSFLRIEHGDPPEKCRFMTPDDPEAFGAPWAMSTGPTWINMDTVVREDDIQLWSKKEIDRELRGGGAS